MARIDYYDDPDAPAASSMVPSAIVVVTDDAERILMIHRSDNDNWAVPGGAMDLGESIVDCAVRETKEETGIDCEVTGLVGIYNASQMPIYEVALRNPTPDGDEPEAADFIGLVPPRQTIRRPAPKEWLAFSPEPIEIEFLDSSGHR